MRIPKTACQGSQEGTSVSTSGKTRVPQREYQDSQDRISVFPRRNIKALKQKDKDSQERYQGLQEGISGLARRTTRVFLKTRKLELLCFSASVSAVVNVSCLCA